MKKWLGGAVKNKLFIVGAALVIALQPIYSVMIAPDARAATVSTVSPNNMNDWMALDDNGQGGSLNFINNLSKIGTGSAQLKVSTPGQGYMLYKPAYGKMKLADITALAYDTYIQAGNNTIAPALQFNIDKDVNDVDLNWQGRLVYEPYRNGNVVDGQWQAQNPLSGKWWFSKPASFDGNCPQSSPCTLDTIKSLYENVGILNANGGGVGFKAGSGWNTPFVGIVDNFVINNDVYDFEAIAAPQLESPTNNVPVQGATLINKWQPVNGAAKYKYESYHNAAATSKRWSQITTETQKTATNVANGTVFWWRVKAIDAQGNEGSWSELWKVTVDNTAPSVPTGGAPHDTYRNTNEFDFTWNEATDNEAGNIRYEFRSSQDSSQLEAVQTYIVDDPQIHSSGAPDGKWYWQVRAIDAAGNKSDWSQVWNVTLDTTAPTLQVTTPEENSVFGGDDQIVVTSHMEDAWGLGNYFIDINSAEVTILNTATGETETAPEADVTETVDPESAALTVIAIFNAKDFTNGKYIITVRVTDKAGNEKTQTRTIFIQHPVVVPGGQGGGIDTGSDEETDTLTQLAERLTQPFSLPQSFAGSTGGSDLNQQVLGLENTDTADVAGGEQVAAAVPSTEGWKLFGVAWYWWLLLAAVLGVATAWIVRRVRPSDAA